MKKCHFDCNHAGAVVGDEVYAIVDALVKWENLRSGYTKLEVIDSCDKAAR